MSVIINWLNSFSVQETLVVLIIMFGVGLIVSTTIAYYVLKIVGKLVYHIARMIYIYHLIRKREMKRR